MQTESRSSQTQASLLYELIELEYDTQAAFEAGITRLEGQAYKSQLRQFLRDQQRHILDLKAVAAPLCDTLPHGADMSRLLTRGLLMLAHLAGDRAILHALGRPLELMNRAYERALSHDGVQADALAVIQRHFVDERRHRDWIARCLHPEDATCQDGVAREDSALFELNNRPAEQFLPHQHN